MRYYFSYLDFITRNWPVWWQYRLGFVLGCGLAMFSSAYILIGYVTPSLFDRASVREYILKQKDTAIAEIRKHNVGDPVDVDGRSFSITKTTISDILKEIKYINSSETLDNAIFELYKQRYADSVYHPIICIISGMMMFGVIGYWFSLLASVPHLPDAPQLRGHPNLLGFAILLFLILSVAITPNVMFDNFSNSRKMLDPVGVTEWKVDLFFAVGVCILCSLGASISIDVCQSKGLLLVSCLFLQFFLVGGLVWLITKAMAHESVLIAMEIVIGILYVLLFLFSIYVSVVARPIPKKLNFYNFCYAFSICSLLNLPLFGIACAYLLFQESVKSERLGFVTVLFLIATLLMRSGEYIFLRRMNKPI